MTSTTSDAAAEIGRASTGLETGIPGIATHRRQAYGHDDSPGHADAPTHTHTSVFGDSAGHAVPDAPPYSAFESEACSIARTLAVIGDRWTLLVLRDVANGVRRFDDLVSHLGIARNVLSRRLAALTEEDLVVRTAYRVEGERERHEYRLSRAGRELVPILLAIMSWGDRHLASAEGRPVIARHADCGAQVRVLVTCEKGHDLGDRPRVRLEPGPGSRRRE